MKENILILFSGGVDSTALLYKCLTDPNYNHMDIHVHHIHLINRERRNKAEEIACNSIVHWLKEKGYEFRYTENVVDYMNTFLNSLFPRDTDICWSIAGIIAQCDPTITWASTGRNATDCEHSSTLEEARERGDNVLYTLSNTKKRKNNPVKNLPVIIKMTKTDLWLSLPKELQDRVWYCRFPKSDGQGFFKKCDQCHTCREMNDILK